VNNKSVRVINGELVAEPFKTSKVPTKKDSVASQYGAGALAGGWGRAGGHARGEGMGGASHSQRIRHRLPRPAPLAPTPHPA
jgi:hypothetical protein